MNSHRLASGAATAALAVFSAGARAAESTWAERLNDKLNMPIGVTEISHTVWWLHMWVFLACVAIGVVVFTAMGISMWRHRKSRGAVPAKFHENTRLEIVWTLIPLVILIVMAVPATGVLIKMYDTGGEDMAIEVRGYQWKWEYTYLDEDREGTLSFFSNLATPPSEIDNQSVKGQYYLLEVDEPLRIPINKKVRFLITSNDVIHSFWVPDFAIKRDAVPGMLNELWTIVEEPGIYRGQCTELCGTNHGFMPIVVHAMKQDEYDAWYANRREQYLERQRMVGMTFSEEELMTMGEEIYNTTCATCHQPNGQGVPPVFPALAGSPVTTGDRNEHIRTVYNGVPGTAMQAFGEQLNAAEIAAVVHYERHSWGNNTGDVTQPADVVNLVSEQ